VAGPRDPHGLGLVVRELVGVKLLESLSVWERDDLVLSPVNEEHGFLDSLNLGLVHKDVPKPIKGHRIKHHTHCRQEDGLQDHTPD